MAVMLLAALPMISAHKPVLAAEDAPDFAAIDRYVTSWMHAARLPGVALGIVRGDEIMHLRGFGVAGPSGAPVTPQTPFAVASLTKSFTTLAIMQLVEAGKVEWDAPVQRYLPWFRVADADASARITLRQLATHTSGLTEAMENDPFFAHSLLEPAARRLATIPLAHPPGTTFAYGNIAYSLLGLVVEAASGQPYDAYVREHILAPLDMQHSSMSGAHTRSHDGAVTYRYWFGRPYPFESPDEGWLLPAAGLYSSAEDMSRYLIAHLNGGRYGQEQLVSPSGIAQLHQPAVDTGFGQSYGLGWFSGSGDSPAVWHAGAASSTMMLFPDQQWGFVVLTNGDNWLRPEQIITIGEGIAALLLGDQPQPVPEAAVGDPVSYTVMVIAVAVPIGLIGIGIRTLRRYRADQFRRSRGWRAIVRVIAPSLLSFSWAWVCLSGVPQFYQTPLWLLRQATPDLGTMLRTGGLLALSWGVAWMAFAVAMCSSFAQTGRNDLGPAPGERERDHPGSRASSGARRGYLERAYRRFRRDDVRPSHAPDP
jgi:CubicO group peptidase (beta-lactamase class C family)